MNFLKNLILSFTNFILKPFKKKKSESKISDEEKKRILIKLMIFTPFGN